MPSMISGRVMIGRASVNVIVCASVPGIAKLMTSGTLGLAVSASACAMYQCTGAMPPSALVTVNVVSNVRSSSSSSQRCMERSRCF